MEENKMLEQLKSEIELSDTVNDAMKQAYDQILDPKTNKVHRRSGKRLVKAAAGVLLAGVEEPTEEELQEMLDSMSPEEWNEYQTKLDALAPTYNYPVNEYLNYIYDVDMHFDFDVNVDTERVKTIEVNDVDSGYPHYLESVTVTPFDIGVQAHGQEGDYQVLLDANGTLVKDLGLKTPISNYDLSKIDYYVIPWETFSEGEGGLTKGDIYEERTEEKLGLTLREALDQYCSYHKEVVIS